MSRVNPARHERRCGQLSSIQAVEDEWNAKIAARRAITDPPLSERAVHPVLVPFAASPDRPFQHRAWVVSQLNVAGEQPEQLRLAPRDRHGWTSSRTFFSAVHAEATRGPTARLRTFRGIRRHRGARSDQS